MYQIQIKCTEMQNASAHPITIYDWQLTATHMYALNAVAEMRRNARNEEKCWKEKTTERNGKRFV